MPNGFDGMRFPWLTGIVLLGSCWTGSCFLAEGQNPGAGITRPAVLLPCAGAAGPTACTDSILSEVVARYGMPGQGSGLVVLSLLVDTGGRLAEVTLLRDPDSLGAALIAAMDHLPGWQPALENGQAVEARFRLPVRIRPARSTAYRLLWGRLDTDMLEQKALRNLPALTAVSEEGDTVAPARVRWTWQKGRRSREKTAPAIPDAATRRWLMRCPTGARLTAEASVPEGTRFVTVMRTWMIAARPHP